MDKEGVSITPDEVTPVPITAGDVATVPVTAGAKASVQVTAGDVVRRAPVVRPRRTLRGERGQGAGTLRGHAERGHQGARGRGRV